MWLCKVIWHYGSTAIYILWSVIDQSTGWQAVHDRHHPAFVCLLVGEYLDCLHLEPRANGAAITVCTSLCGMARSPGRQLVVEAGRSIAHWVKHLLCKHEGLNLVPQHPLQSWMWQLVLVIPIQGRNGEQWVPSACQLAKTVSSGFGGRPYLKSATTNTTTTSTSNVEN